MPTGGVQQPAFVIVWSDVPSIWSLSAMKFNAAAVAFAVLRFVLVAVVCDVEMDSATCPDD